MLSKVWLMQKSVCSALRKAFFRAATETMEIREIYDIKGIFLHQNHHKLRV